MKLSMSTLGCPDWSFEEILEGYSKVGIKAIELRGIKEHMEAWDIPQLREENLNAARAALDKYGMSIISFNTSVSFDYHPTVDEEIANGKRAIDICQKAGIPSIRVFGDHIDPDKREEIINDVCRGYTELCAYAGERGINVNQEVHGNFNNIKNLTPVFENVGAKFENYGMIFDIGNVEDAENWVEFYEFIKPKIRHVHIKDHIMVNGKHKGCLPGQGEVRIADIVRRMMDDGYEGYFSFEWEKRWQKDLAEPEEAFPAFVEFMKNL